MNINEPGYAFPSNKVREKIIENMCEEYSFLEKEIIGESVCGRNIYGLRIGNKKIAVLLTASFHGMEWLTSLLLLKFIGTLCSDIKKNSKFCGIDIIKQLSGRGIAALPCINPDGVEISLLGSKSAGIYSEQVHKICGGKTDFWQSNARGVDLNHNYNAGWAELQKLEQKSGIFGPAPTRYGGSFPESEPETQALTRFCRNNYFDYALAFHSQGEEIYWKYSNKIPENSEILAKAFAIASGYELSQPEGLAVGGGFKDWFITEFNRPAFTVEIGKGTNPLPLSDLPEIYNKLENMLFMSVLI